MKPYLLFACVSLLCCCTKAPEPVLPIPSPEQVAWQKMETNVFVHFGLNTFTGDEWGYGNVPLEKFNPTKLDCSQWAGIFAKAGIKGVILTAKHHDGFCLWPSPVNEYSVRNTPVPVDIVGELSEACRAEGLKFGIYLSPWDRHQASYGTSEYVEYYYSQLGDLLSNYGPFFELWLDGANGGDGWYGGACESRTIDRRTYYDFPRALEMARGAVVFSDGGPGCRWVGNEKGEAGTTNWAFLRAGEVYPGYDKSYELPSGHSDGTQWTAAECDVSIRPGWFYHSEEDSRVKTPEQLLDLYYKSVGRNGLLLLNIPPTPEGLIHPTDSAALVGFRQRLDAEFAHNLLKSATVEASSRRGRAYAPAKVLDGDYDSYWATPDGVTEGRLTFSFKEPTTFDHLGLQEYIPLGQRVGSFSIEYELNGKWLPLELGEPTTTIGYKRLLRFEPITAKRLRINFLSSRGPLCINEVGAWKS